MVGANERCGPSQTQNKHRSQLRTYLLAAGETDGNAERQGEICRSGGDQARGRSSRSPPQAHARSPPEARPAPPGLTPRCLTVAAY